MHVGVIGVGWWGKSIVNTLERNPRVSRIIMFDERVEAYESVRNNQKTTLAESMSEVLSDPSIVGVCLATPPATHYDYSKQILLAGKHLLIEKPPAYSVSEVRELGEIAKARNLVYMLDALYLFLEPVQKLKQLILSGELNSIIYVQMYRVGDEIRRPGVGIERLQNAMFANGIDVIDDLFFHDAAILLHLFGDFEYLGSEKLRLYHPSLCDSAKIKLEVSGGIPVELTLSWTQIGRKRGIVIYSRDSIVEYDGLRNDRQITRFFLADNRLETLTFPPSTPLSALLDNYLRCIEGNACNILDCTFMEKITTIWRRIANEN